MFSLDNDFLPFLESYKKLFDKKTIQIGEWYLIRLGVANATGDNDLDPDDFDDNDFIENQVGIQITIADVSIEGKSFTLIDLGDGNSALCKDLLYKRDDYSDDITAFTETLYNLKPNLFEGSEAKEYVDVLNAIKKFDTKGNDYWVTNNSSSPNNLNIPFPFWLLSSLTLAAKDSDSAWIYWLTGYPHELEKYFFYEGRDSTPIAKYSPSVFMICSKIDDSEGEFTFKDGLFSLSECEDKYKNLSDFFSYLSDNSHVIGLSLSKDS